MSIALQHLQCLVAGDGGPLHGVQALLEEAAGGFMAKIVEVKSFNPRFLCCPNERMGYIQPCENFSADISWQSLERIARS